MLLASILALALQSCTAGVHDDIEPGYSTSATASISTPGASATLLVDVVSDGSCAPAPCLYDALTAGSSDVLTLVLVNYGTGFGPGGRWTAMPAGSFSVPQPMAIPCGVEVQAFLEAVDLVTLTVLDSDFVYMKCGPCLPE